MAFRVRVATSFRPLRVLRCLAEMHARLIGSLVLATSVATSVVSCGPVGTRDTGLLPAKTGPSAPLDPQNGPTAAPSIGVSARAGSPEPAASQASVAFDSRTPTRVSVPSLGIDVPVVAPSPTESFPLCDVAEYLPSLSRPGFAGVTYVYAHARIGMFLPLLEAAIHDLGKLEHAEVRVFTNDDDMFTYRVSEVRRGLAPATSSIADALTATTEQLWLQTSEGPFISSTKLVVIARPESGPVPVSAADAHPSPHPRVCR